MSGAASTLQDATPSSSRVTVSVVSHGHDADVRRLLRELANCAVGRVARVVVTHNLPLPADAPPWPACDGIEVVHLRNVRPQGFAHNHNAAFVHCHTDYFCVLNPDVHDTSVALWDQLMVAADQPGAGCAYPLLRNPDGTPQDNERELPTPWALWRRRVLRRRDARVDWVSAACWMVPSHVWRALGGLDAGFRMYVEDVEWCLRLQLAGWRLQRADVALVHRAQRDSHRRILYLAWHVLSLWRLWRMPVFTEYARRRHT